MRCLEFYQYTKLREKLASGRAGEDEQKKWRLSVKRRLNRKHREELDALLTVSDQQASCISFCMAPLKTDAHLNCSFYTISWPFQLLNGTASLACSNTTPLSCHGCTKISS